MPIVLPNGLETQEIRVLQEFRRLNSDTLPLAVIKGIRHPAGGGEAPAVRLVDKGFLTTTDAGETFSITDRGRDFLAIQATPEVKETSDAAASAAEDPDADGV